MLLNLCHVLNNNIKIALISGSLKIDMPTKDERPYDRNREKSDFRPMKIPENQSKANESSIFRNGTISSEQKVGSHSKRDTGMDKDKGHSDHYSYDKYGTGSMIKRDEEISGRIHGVHDDEILSRSSYIRGSEHSRGSARDERRMSPVDSLLDARPLDRPPFDKSERYPGHTGSASWKADREGSTHDAHTYHEDIHTDRYQADRRTHLEDSNRSTYRDDYARRRRPGQSDPDYFKRKKGESWDESPEYSVSERDHDRSDYYDVKKRNQNRHHDTKIHTLEKPLVININDCSGAPGGRYVHKFIIKPRPCPPCPHGPHGQHGPHGLPSPHGSHPITGDPYAAHHQIPPPSPPLYYM